MWGGFTLSERALHNVRKVCDNTKDMGFAKFVQAFSLR